ncbi:hypothetical protein CXB51_003915 [Gossypium anomalum]|uniref:DUF7745 domain-containing protein n=1 Tax=Gossypium anomalum TaxID=47600 RepID=A0A8J5ZJ80_9ROSI|nr:hypothetical protein CXB51_003915 [Gossypium anomalum]
MRNEYLNKVEDNAFVCTWSEKTQLEKGDSELRNIWAQWDDEVKQLFYQSYGDLPYLLDVKVDRHLFRAMMQFWNPAYSCFTFGDVDLVPTLEEYTTLLHCPSIQGYKAYVRPVSLLTFVKKLVMITGMSEQWAVAHVQQKGDIIFPKALGHIDESVADLFDRFGKQNTPLLLVWFHSHFWKIDKNLREEDVMWKAPWMVPSEVLYRCGGF